jgi:hypothetical protein
MKERLRKKMEERKMREALASASASVSASVMQSPSIQTPSSANKNIVVKIGDEKQEKSGLRPPPPNASVPLTEDELVTLFKNDKPKKKKSKK